MSRKPLVAETKRVKATLPAAARGTVIVPADVPEGYVLAGVLGLGSTATGDAAPVVWWIENDVVSTDWRNLTSKNITAEFMAQVLYLPA